MHFMEKSVCRTRPYAKKHPLRTCQNQGALPKTVAEFFAGVGLMRLGLEREQWNVIYANDIAADKYAMYTASPSGVSELRVRTTSRQLVAQHFLCASPFQIGGPCHMKCHMKCVGRS